MIVYIKRNQYLLVTMTNLHKSFRGSLGLYLVFLAIIKTVITENITTAQAITASIMAAQTPLLIPSLWFSTLTVGGKKKKTGHTVHTHQ